MNDNTGTDQSGTLWVNKTYLFDIILLLLLVLLETERLPAKKEKKNMEGKKKERENINLPEGRMWKSYFTSLTTMV